MEQAQELVNSRASKYWTLNICGCSVFLNLTHTNVYFINKEHTPMSEYFSESLLNMIMTVPLNGTKEQKSKRRAKKCRF